MVQAHRPLGAAVSAQCVYFLFSTLPDGHLGADRANRTGIIHQLHPQRFVACGWHCQTLAERPPRPLQFIGLPAGVDCVAMPDDGGGADAVALMVRPATNRGRNRHVHRHIANGTDGAGTMGD